MARSKNERWVRVMVNLRPKTFERLREASAQNSRSLSGEGRYRLERSFEEAAEPPIDGDGLD